MKTKKITLNEFKTIVKKIVKEENENNQRFGVLPQDFRYKEVFTRDDLKKILDNLKNEVDEIATYRIYNLERFLGISDE